MHGKSEFFSHFTEMGRVDNNNLVNSLFFVSINSSDRLPNQATLIDLATYCLFRQLEFMQLCRI